MTRETWRRARASFDQAWKEFHGAMLPAWEELAAEQYAENLPRGEGAVV